tara:strand:- start:643 stop:864 length:222 start_codon:yes stop_codon:yes gene_type:complete
MRAIHKYQGSNKIEHKRRIAQSYGYKHSIMENPRMLLLLQRGGIEFDSVDYDYQATEDVSAKQPLPDTETLSL